MLRTNRSGSTRLYDPVNRIIGMNHFLLGNRRYARKLPVCLSEAGRYGINAMELLINDMLKLGAAKKNLRAKAFGGGSIYKNPEVKDNFICVGNVNILFIREFLTIEGIPLIAEDLGGDKARIIHFLSEDYSVHVRRFGKTIPKDLTVNERRFWLKSIETQERTGGQAEIWG
jgi:chemotaxis protein CheD